MRPVLIDTDPGVDDALALLLAWSSPEIRVDAITTVAGNVDVDQATTNLIRLVALRRPSPLPVIARGAARPLRRPLVTAHHYHGADGLGGVDDWAAGLEVPAHPTGWELIAQEASRRGPDITVIALGPLTNLALALDRDAGALHAVRRIVVMGGAVDVPGNVTPESEFNIHVDPDAAARVMDAGLMIDLVPLDATRQAMLAQSHLERALADRAGPVASRIAAFTAHAFARGEGLMALHDPLAVGVAIDETFVEWEPARIRVGAGGETRRAPGTPNCRVARVVDSERFIATFLGRVAPPRS
jgi:purine nucleosidase/pyrimidine-specific ribonucleoside hydrolase